VIHFSLAEEKIQVHRFVQVQELQLKAVALLTVPAVNQEDSLSRDVELSRQCIFINVINFPTPTSGIHVEFRANIRWAFW